MHCSMHVYFHLTTSLDFLPLVMFPKPVAFKKGVSWWSGTKASQKPVDGVWVGGNVFASKAVIRK